MTPCPARGTDRWAAGRPIPEKHTPDPQYETGVCWDCGQRVALRSVPASFGLPGMKQVLVDHESAGLVWKHWRCHEDWWTNDFTGHGGGNECPRCGNVGELIEEVAKP